MRKSLFLVLAATVLAAAGCSPFDAEARRPRDRRFVAGAGSLSTPVDPDSGAAGYVDEYALIGDGASTYVDCDALYSELSNGGTASAATVCFRIKKDDTASSGTVFGMQTAASGNNGTNCVVGADESITCLNAGVSSAPTTTAAGFVALSTWTAVCHTWGAASSQIWKVEASGATNGATASRTSAAVTLNGSRVSIFARANPTFSFLGDTLSEIVWAPGYQASETDVEELIDGSGEWQDPLETSWAAHIDGAFGLGDGDGDSATTTIENRVTGNTCTPTNFAAEDLVAGGEG